MRIICILLLLLGFCSCSLNPRPTQIKCEPVTQFSCTVRCKQDENSYTFSLASQADKTMSVLVMDPDLLAGVCFTYTDDTYTVDANGMENTFRENVFTEDSPVRMLFEALQVFLFTGAETLTNLNDDTFGTQNTVGMQTASAVFTQDGHLLSIDYPNKNTTFTFSYSDEE